MNDQIGVITSVINTDFRPTPENGRLGGLADKTLLCFHRKSLVHRVVLCTAAAFVEDITIATTTMLLPRTRAFAAGSQPCLLAVESALSNLRLSQPLLTKTTTAIRNSTSLSQGRANGAKDGAGKRLGAKKSGGTLPQSCRSSSTR